MPECATREPDVYPVAGAEVRCLLYAERAKRAG
jgi:hypothetical protein